MARRFARRYAFAALLIAGLMHPPCSADEPGLVARDGTVRLGSGGTAHYAWSYYQRDGNALAGALSAGDSIVALTDAGALLRFDRATLKLTKEWSGEVAVSCLGRGEGGAVLAGFADGRIARVDPASLATTELARSTGELAWVGATTGGAAEKPRIIAVVLKPRLAVHDLGAGKTYDLGGRLGRPGAFLLDRQNRLWLGADNGEWAGWCVHVDLATGQVQDVPGLKFYKNSGPTWLGVYGFAELHDGQVWAYGGIMHMGSTEGFIGRVDRGKAEELYRRDNAPLMRRMLERVGVEVPRAKGAPEPPFATDRPYLPITHIIEEPGSGTLVVLAFSEMYRTDARLAGWRKVDELEIGYRAGRPDAVGMYPSVRSVEPIAEPGRPPGFLFATRLDGLLRLVDGKITRSTPLGQLDVETTARIVPSSEGVLLFPDSDDGEGEDAVWRYRDGGWAGVSFAPPYKAHPAADDEKGAPPDMDWSSTTTLVGRDGSIHTVNAAYANDEGTHTTARWRDGKAEVLGSEVSTLVVEASFVTPDGALWNAENSILRRFTGGRWVDVGATRDPRGVRRADWNGLDLRLTAVNDAGPPWILHDRRGQWLLRLAYGPGFTDPRLTVVSLTEPGLEGRVKVEGAIAGTQKGELLLATDRGLRTFAIDGGKLSVAGVDSGGRSVSRLARDGRGRLWLGGEGLMVLEADGKTLHALDAVPKVGRSKIEALAADPAHPDGAIAAVAGRGVVFVRVEAR
jgi:hypothetical protein